MLLLTCLPFDPPAAAAAAHPILLSLPFTCLHHQATERSELSEAEMKEKVLSYVGAGGKV
jgi:polysaccharide deacetylase 2 family uncharacterized protein YibQ